MLGPCMIRTLAALADAHDEHMVIVRMADTDQVDSVHCQQELCRHASELHPKASAVTFFYVSMLLMNVAQVHSQGHLPLQQGPPVANKGYLWSLLAVALLHSESVHGLAVLCFCH